ncbi:MAG TPA: amino acid racemase [Candidatus Dormibacteraeota bacterium]|nr:amino acid racemase [Candidatus Dormibacteraeota bacterium]
MRTLGIVGGTGPDSTAEYYRTIVEISRARAAGGYPRILITSVSSVEGTRVIELVSADRRRELVARLLAELRTLEAAGAEIGLLASNTLHVVFDELQTVSPIPLVSIVEAAAEAATGSVRLGLFATTFTIRADLYRPVFARRGIEVVAPSAMDQELIHRAYFEELTAGMFLPVTRDRLLDIADRMVAAHDLDGIILGGTELPLLLPEESRTGLRFLDTSRIHAEAVVARLLDLDDFA